MQSSTLRRYLQPSLLGLLVVVGCSKPAPPPSASEFVEWLEVEGTCQEDHVNKPGNYSGELVHYRNKATGKASRYGHVTNSADMVESVLAHAKDPNSYQTPFIVSFDDITESDLTEQSFMLHGVAEHVTSENGDGPRYKATCNLAVTKRLDRFPSDAERFRKQNERKRRPS